MKNNNLTIGHLGEAIAKQYLENHGYKIIAQNYRTKYCEIDLITRDKKSLVFVEVRTKIGEKFGMPDDSFTRAKIQRLIRGATAYVAYIVKGADIRPLQYRIDAICIVLGENNNPKRISHYKNITF